MGLKIGSTDNAASAEGQWVNVYHDAISGYVWWMDHEPALSENGEVDARLKIAAANNPDARSFSRKEMRRYRHLARRGDGLPEHIALKVLREQYANTILLDWDGVEFPDGSVPDYDPERAVEAFEADRDFFDLVVDIANTRQAFRDAAVADAGEEVGNASGGSANGADTSPSLSVQGSSSTASRSGTTSRTSPTTTTGS